MPATSFISKALRLQIVWSFKRSREPLGAPYNIWATAIHAAVVGASPMNTSDGQFADGVNDVSKLRSSERRGRRIRRLETQFRLLSALVGCQRACDSVSTTESETSPEFSTEELESADTRNHMTTTMW